MGGRAIQPFVEQEDAELPPGCTLHGLSLNDERPIKTINPEARLQDEPPRVVLKLLCTNMVMKASAGTQQPDARCVKLVQVFEDMTEQKVKLNCSGIASSRNGVSFA